MKINIKSLVLLIAISLAFSSCSSFLSDEIKAKSRAEAAEKMKKPQEEEPDDEIPTAEDYIGTWESIDTEDEEIEVAITEDKIWITVTDDDGETFRLVDGESYTVNEDGTITVTGKDKDGNPKEYIIKIDENGNIVITDGDDNKIATCEKKSDEPPAPPAPLPPAQQPDPTEPETPAEPEPAESNVTFTFPNFTDTADTISVEATTVTQGTKVTLSMPNTYSAYQWWIDSNPVSGATNSSYEWDTSSVESGAYRIMCVAKDTSGKKYSASVTIIVKETISLD